MRLSTLQTKGKESWAVTVFSAHQGSRTVRKIQFSKYLKIKLIKIAKNHRHSKVEVFRTILKKLSEEPKQIISLLQTKV